MTLSILGRCERTGRLGMAVASSSMAVAARCAYVRAGVGVVASQNVTDPRLGPRLLDAMAAGAAVETAIATVMADAPFADYRQVAALDATGAGGVWSGAHTLGVNGTRIGDGWITAGNLLASEDVLAAMGAAFGDSDGSELETRLVDALAAGVAAGGEAGQEHSAGLLVTGAAEWPVTDLRVDWAHDDGPGPVTELAALWRRWAPERDDYVSRGLDPASAPAYGVPGDPA